MCCAMSRQLSGLKLNANCTFLGAMGLTDGLAALPALDGPACPSTPTRKRCNSKGADPHAPDDDEDGAFPPEEALGDAEADGAASAVMYGHIHKHHAFLYTNTRLIQEKQSYPP